MKVKDVMSTKLITFKPEDTLHEALQVFTSKGISGAPVVKDGKLAGLITELDVIKVIDIYTPKVHFTSMPHFFLVLAGLKSRKKATELKKKIMAASKLQIQDFMTQDPVTIEEDVDIMEAARIIDTYKVNRIPVVEKGKVRGIVTRNDIIKAVARLDTMLTERRKK
ncbi:MAG: CBS domain-containing protein [Candidatus Aenigmatarchaeota archaeon]|nr:MAG: CBS domain-containing protein [Candidatus Aenigmarchaeota archaeon]